jgi:tRNA-dihydrouridine synthase
MIRVYFQMLLDEAEATKDLPRAERLGETAGKMKQFATWFTHGVAGGAKLRAAIYRARAGAEVLAQVDAFFKAQLANGAETDADSGLLPAIGSSRDATNY